MNSNTIIICKHIAKSLRANAPTKALSKILQSQSREKLFKKISKC